MCEDDAHGHAVGEEADGARDEGDGDAHLAHEPFTRAEEERVVHEEIGVSEGVHRHERRARLERLPSLRFSTEDTRMSQTRDFLTREKKTYARTVRWCCCFFARV